MKMLKILVVDDKKSHRKYIGDVLQSAGHEVVELANTKEARDKLNGDETYDLMVLDQMLPYQTGTEFVEELRKEEKFRYLPIILITAYPEDEAVQKASKENLYVLIKPMRDYHDILDAVNRVLR